VKASYLVRGTPGHPSHPPLTDATIGIYTLATITAVLGALGVSEENMARAWWLALVIGIVVSVPTIVTGLADWLTLERGTPTWRTATSHALANATGSVFFILAAIVGHGGYVDADVNGGGLVLTLVGFAFLSLGGWLGGTIVFGHGMRVLELPEQPSAQTVGMRPTPEEERRDPAT